MQTFALLGAKNSGFFEIYGCSHGQGGEGVEPVWKFCGQGGGDRFFAILCVYGRPLKQNILNTV